MRILHFGKFSGRAFGGIETHVRGLTEGLAAAGLDVVNLTYDIGRAHGAVEEERVNGVRVVRVPCPRTIASLPLAPATFATVARLSGEAPFDVVHGHFPDPLAFAAMPSAGRSARVASWHSDIVRQRVFGKVYATIARGLFAPLDAVAGATASHLSSPQIDAFRPRLRRVVPYGIDVDRLALTPAVTAAAERLRAAAQGRSIVFALGRHVYYKGFDVLIDAMQDLDAVLLLGGSGPMTAALQARARRSTGRGEVRFVGRIPDDALPAYYHACSVYCLPSLARSEAFGLVQAEAMACARPVVNCRLDNAVNEVSPDGVSGLTARPDDPRSLRDALGRLLADPVLRATLGRRGQERVAERFSVRAMIDATLDMYGEILSSPNPSAKRTRP